MPLFCEDTHTENPPEDRFALTLPLLHLQSVAMPTLFTLTLLDPLPRKPRVYPVPDVMTVFEFIENIWHKARLTPQSLVICLVYVDRFEARSEGVVLHARSWRPIVFASLLLASKVYHDISYWNSDFSTICPMFTVPNINSMERACLELLQYNTIISASQYASYYFLLRTAARKLHQAQQNGRATAGERTQPTNPRPTAAVSTGRNNFRSKYFNAINLTGTSTEREPTAPIAKIPQSTNRTEDGSNSSFQLFGTGLATSL